MITTEHKPVQQAFGSPGGKSYLASKIVGMIPPHKTYVEPFAGGAAVYFKKPLSEKEVLSDKDRRITFAFKFLRDMTPEQFKRLKKYNWKVSKGLFDKLKASKPKDDVEKFRQFYYLRKASFGNASNTVSPLRDGTTVDIDKLQRVHERLKRTTIYREDALAVIRKQDSPSTFFYLDPPYPDRAFIGAKDTYTNENLAKLVKTLKGIKGKFMLSLGTEHAKLLPQNWHIKRTLVRRRGFSGGSFNQSLQYEIIATNYNPEIKTGRQRIPFASKRKLITKRRNGHRRKQPAEASLLQARTYRYGDN